MKIVSVDEEEEEEEKEEKGMTGVKDSRVSSEIELRVHCAHREWRSWHNDQRGRIKSKKDMVMGRMPCKTF